MCTNSMVQLVLPRVFFRVSIYFFPFLVSSYLGPVENYEAGVLVASSFFFILFFSFLLQGVCSVGTAFEAGIST